MDLARRELRRALQEIVRIEGLFLLEVPVKDDDRIWTALHDTPPPSLPGVFAAWNLVRVRRRTHSYGVSYTVGRGFYTTGIVPFFSVLFPGDQVVACFPSGGHSVFGGLVGRFAVERGLAAIGLRFPRGLWTPEGMALTWDLLSGGGDLAPCPGLPALPAPGEPGVYRSQDEGEIALPPVRWREQDERLTTFRLRWRPRRLELVLPDVGRG